MPSRKKKHRKSPRKDAVPQKADPPLDERTVSACEHQRLMQEWAELGTPPPVIRGLSDLGFSHPTPIQKMAIPPAISEGVDIIGAAETGSGKTLAFSIPILHYILKLHPHLQSPLTPASSKSKQSTDQKKREKSKPQKRKHGDSKEPSSSKKKPTKSQEWESGGVIDLNQVLHSTQEDLTELHSGFDPQVSESDQEQLEVGGSEPDSEEEDYVPSEGHTESEDEQVEFVVDSNEEDALSDGEGALSDEEDALSDEEGALSDGEGALSDGDGGSQLLSGDGGLFVEGIGEEELPKKKRKRASVYRMMRERVRAKRRCGVRDRRRCEAVRVCDNIPEEEFRLMLEGKLDVQSSSSPKTTHTNKLDHSQTAEESLPPTKTDSGCGSTTESGCSLIALILTPTRELALQVHSHIKAVAKHTGVRVCTVVGGMATEKQERLLKLHPHIVVATPGRLWKLISEGEPHLCNHDDLHFIVLDEADRMIEFGHYRELSYILDRLNGTRVKGHSEVKVHDRQTLVFSATLTLPRRTTERKKKKKITSSQETIESLMVRVGLQHDARIVDLTRSKVTVQTLTETKIMCTAEEKDLHLYYFLLVHPGRTIVFVNSIDCLQRVRAVLELLERRPLPLHAHMQQRQRLKNLDRFSSSDTAVLVASDVAARGLDLPQVEHIVHYQVPRNSELYVHRSGRTARGQREGLSVMLVGPEDLKSYRNICRTLNRDDIPNFPVDYPHLMSLRGRISLARQVHTIEYRRDKVRRSERWMSQTADALGVELDQEQLSQHGSWTKKEERRLQELRGQLKDLLQTVVLPRGVSRKFPTRDQDHTLLSQLQGQRSGLSAPIVLEKEKALLLAKKHQRTIA